MRAGIALGSNLGDRHANLSHAVEKLRTLHERGEFLVSSFYQTEPVDCPPDSPFFLNAVVELDTSLPPLELLKKTQQLEIDSGRPSNHSFHAPRSIDLDILYYDNLVFQGVDLQLPHPRMMDRLFVMEPLAEIRPDLILFEWTQSAADYFKIISNK